MARSETQMDKATLDNLIRKHKVQPLGNGYIDIIVSREYYKQFVTDLVSEGYKIDSISWWEWCPETKINEYGLGGPKSKYFNGWFSELPIDTDHNDLSGAEKETVIKGIIGMIERKTIQYPGETITFKDHVWLTPALWLNVPEDWENVCA